MVRIDCWVDPWTGYNNSYNHTNRKLNPPPFSSSSLPPNIPPKSPAPSIGASPLFGALGLATLRRFSWFALLGKVGKREGWAGLGSSLK